MALKLGFGSYNITPPLGVPMAGYAQREGAANDVHDDLTARAVAFESAGEAAALVAVDTCMLPLDVRHAVCERVAQRTGIPASAVIAAAVHTHSGPALREPSAYRSLLPALVASAVELAWRRRQPADLLHAHTQVPGLCVNRRTLDGPVDEEIDLLAARDAEGRPLGVLFSYPLHGVVMGSNNLAISADYMGVARRVIEAAQPGATAVFVAAPSGEMNPLTPSVKRQLAEHGDAWYTDDPLTGIYDRTSGTFEETEQLGRTLGEAARAAVAEAQPVPCQHLAARTVDVDLGADEPLPVPVGLLRLGDAVVMALAGEHFIDTGRRLRAVAREAGLHPVVVSHAGQFSYVPPEQCFAEGGYEIELARRRGIAPDAQTRLVECVRRELPIL